MFDYGSHDLQDPLLEPIQASEHTEWSFIINFSIKENEVDSIHYIS